MASIRDKLAQKKSKLAKPRTFIEQHPADTKTHSEGSFFKLDINLIKPNPNQPRQHFDEKALEELTESIKQSGVLQPVIIRKDDDGTIFLVAGERRLRASKRAGLEEIPTILTKGNPNEIALIENLQRQNLNPIEESEALNRMVYEYQYTQQQLSKVIGKGRSTIAESLSLCRLPVIIKDECRKNNSFSRRQLLEVSKQESEDDMLVLFKKIKDNNLTGDQIRKITRGKQKPKKDTPVILAYKKSKDCYKHLEKIDINSAEESDRDKLIEMLKQLNGIIETIINPEQVINKFE